MSKHNNRIVVFLKQQLPAKDPVLHTCSPSLARKVLLTGKAKIVARGIQLTTPETWCQVKHSFDLYFNKATLVPFSHITLVRGERPESNRRKF